MPQRKFPLIPVALAVVAVGFLLYAAIFWFVLPWRTFDAQLADLDSKIDEKFKQILQLRKERAALDRFEAMSLPTSMEYAQLEYDRYLETLVTRHVKKTGSGLRFAGVTVKMPDQKAAGPGASKKNDPVYTALTYRLDAQASLGHLVSLLREFEQTPLMHRIRSLDVKPADGEDKKDTKKTFKKNADFQVAIHMEIEAIIVEGASRRSHTLLGPDERLVEISALSLLTRGPGTIALIPWVVGPVGPVAQAKAAKFKDSRDHSRIERDNIFIGYQKKEKAPVIKPEGPVEPTTPTPKTPQYDMREFYKLILISKTPDGDEAWLYSVFKDHRIRLKTRPGFNQFAITDMEGEKTLIKGKVLKIDYGAVYFESLDNHKVYCIQRGESMKEATQHAVPESELTKIGLKIAKAQ